MPSDGWRTRNLGFFAHARRLKQRPDIGPAVAASPAGKLRLEIREPDIIGPAASLDLSRSTSERPWSLGELSMAETQRPLKLATWRRPTRLCCRMPRRLNAQIRPNSYIAVSTFLSASTRREAGNWTGEEIGDRCTDGRDRCRISAVANAPTGFVRKRRTAVLIRRTVFVVLSRALLRNTDRAPRRPRGA
jgi:hypothetical protein